MKSKVDAVNAVSKSYPYLGFGTDNQIVMFVYPGAGMVVGIMEGKLSDYGVGYYSCAWSEGAFNPFVGSVTLSN